MARSGKFEELAALVASGRTVKKAAGQLKLTERTAYRWNRQPEFRELVKRLRVEMATRALGMITGSMAKAARKLRSLIDSPDSKLARRAARDVLELHHQMNAQSELEERIQALEKQAKRKP
jgi:hypothetical protein